ncbi:hypothetical protein EJ04DRAFT_542486 [Polyplosphaeria fusca]|uniref:Zn(2)-C6 fungal-type domain-containing protein n=1 Tax=Polyplosphaeria fusca TaxID=682080 RepID=A0A9P4V4N3_9PLEO|nr:hypothetical protein EJ04DRAFT_542486 [Polyplosphaeria fusca]
MSTDAPPQRIVPPSRRRDKPILSCNLCRRRKLKCDRQHPCKTCMDRGLSLSCTYTKLAAASEPKEPHNVHDRIEQLERLVATLMDGQKAPREAHTTQPVLVPASEDFHDPHSVPQDTSHDTGPEIAGTPDRVKLDEDSTSYTGSGHWASILDGIAELKDHLDEIPTTALSRDPTHPELVGPDLLFGRHRHATQAELIVALPPKAEADKLVAIYFTSLELAAAILHKPTFVREYEQFWQQPFEAPIMFMGLIYSVLCIATRFQHVSENYGDGYCDPAVNALCAARMNVLREKAVQCMILGNYVKCPPYTVELFMQYFVTEYMRSPDSQFGTWVVIGMLIRIAFRTGYHRDGSDFPNISPFKAEMRRRAWSMIVQLDLMSSTQVGLPRMIHKSMYDTKQPRHLAEEDLFEDMTELPPPRPDTESSVMLYSLTRNHILEIYTQIVDLTTSTHQPAYRDIMILDEALRNEYYHMPAAMKALRLNELHTVDAAHDDTIRRLYLGLAFLKCELTLHRPYFLLGRTDNRFEFSRLVCLDAAMEILEFQQTFESECRPGGKFWSYRWRLWSTTWRLSSIVNHDFLLATTVLSLDLDKDLISPLPPSNTHLTNRVRFKSGQPTRAEIIDALTRAYNVWVEAAESSHEARKVETAVRLVLSKANASAQIASNQSPSSASPLPANDPFATFLQPMGMPTNVNTGSLAFASPFGDGSMDIEGMDWNNINSAFPFTTFEQHLQEPFLH